MKEKIIFTNKKILKFKSDSALISKTNQSNKMKSYIFNRESYAIRSNLVAQTIANREIKSALIPYLINGPNLRAWQRQNKLFRYKKNNKHHYRKLKYFKRSNARIVRAWIRRFKYNRKKLLSKNKTKFKIYSHRKARTKLSRKYRGLRTRTFWYKKKRGKRVPYNLVLLRFITKLKTITTSCLIQKQALNKNNNKFFLALKKLAKQKINPRTLRANRTRFKRKLKKKQSSSKLKTKISIKWVKKLQNQIYACLRNRRVSSVTLQNAIYVHVKNKSIAQKIDVKYLKKSKFNMKWFARSIISSIVKAKLKLKRLKKIYSKKFSKSFQKKKEIAKKNIFKKEKLNWLFQQKKSLRRNV